MGGAAEHAAVNENVELAKQARAARAGLVNAVLRRGAREGPAILAGLDDESPEAAAVLHSVPGWLASIWWDELGADEARALLRVVNEPGGVGAAGQLDRGHRRGCGRSAAGPEPARARAARAARAARGTRARRPVRRPGVRAVDGRSRPAPVPGLDARLEDPRAPPGRPGARPVRRPGWQDHAPGRADGGSGRGGGGRAASGPSVRARAHPRADGRLVRAR